MAGVSGFYNFSKMLPDRFVVVTNLTSMKNQTSSTLKGFFCAIALGLALLSCQPGGWSSNDDDDPAPDSTGTGSNGTPVSITCGTNTVGGTCIEGNNTFVERARNVGAFSSISSDVCGRLKLVQGSNAVRVKTAENLQALIEAFVENGELKLRIKEGSCIRPRQEIEIEVSTPALTTVRLTGGITASVSGAWPGQASWNFTTSGGVTISYDNTASAEELVLTSTGNVQFNGFSLSANNVRVSLTGSGIAKVTAVRTLNATIIGTGQILYKGNPVVTRQIVGGGSVTQSN